MVESKYLWCIVSDCKSTIEKTPHKLFIKVPNDAGRREIWLKFAGRDPKVIPYRLKIYVCEDHFDLEKDMENYSDYKSKGFVRSIHMKSNCRPSKFPSLPKRANQKSEDFESIQIRKCSSLTFRTGSQLKDRHNTQSWKSIKKANFGNHCRACIKGEGEINIFNVHFHQVTLSRIIFLCCDEKITFEDGLSKYICRKCLELLIESFKFIKMFKENQVHMKNLQTVFNSDGHNRTVYCTENQYVTRVQGLYDDTLEQSGGQIINSIEHTEDHSNNDISKKNNVREQLSISSEINSENPNDKTQDDQNTETIILKFDEHQEERNKKSEDNSVITGGSQRGEVSWFYMSQWNSANTNLSFTIDGKPLRKRRKYFCKFCREYIVNFPRHLERIHSDEPEVKQLMALNRRSRNRRTIIARLGGSEGNFKTKVIPVTRSAGFPPSKYVSKHCNTRAEALKLMAKCFGPCDPLRTSGILMSMRPDEISLVATRDATICKLARSYIRTHRSKSQLEVAKRNMRRLARLLVESRQLIGDQSLNLSNILNPYYYDVLIKSVKIISGYNEVTRTFKSPSFAFEIGTLIKYAVKTEIMNRSNTVERIKELKSMTDFMATRWSKELQCIIDQKIKKSDCKPSIIAIVEDIKIYGAYLKYLMSQSKLNLSRNPNDSRAYINLLEGIFCSLMIFNRTRISDVELLDIQSVSKAEDVMNCTGFQTDFSQPEKILYKYLKRIMIDDMQVEQNSIMMNSFTMESIRYLLISRKYFEMKKHLLFEIPGKDNPINGLEVMEKHATSALQNDDRASFLTSTRLTKLLPMITQILDMEIEDQEELISFLESATKPPSQGFSLTKNVSPIVVVAELLLLYEKDNIESFTSRHLKEINDGLNFVDNSSNDLPESLGHSQYLRINEAKNIKHGKQVAVGIFPHEKRDFKQLKRIHTKWTAEQKILTEKHFADHIKKKIAPKKHEVMALVESYPIVFMNKPYTTIKAYVYSKYRAK